LSVIARRYFERAGEALRRGEVDTARDDLRAALEVAPYFVAARVAYAILLAREGSAARAAELLRAGIAAQQRPGRPATGATISLERTLGEVLIAASDYRGSEQAFARAAEAAAAAGLPQHDLADRLARLRAKTGRYAESLDQLLIAARSG